MIIYIQQNIDAKYVEVNFRATFILMVKKRKNIEI